MRKREQVSEEVSEEERTGEIGRDNRSVRKREHVSV